MTDRKENTEKHQRADSTPDREKRSDGLSEKGGKQNPRDGGMVEPRRDDQGGRSAKPKDREGFREKEEGIADTDRADRNDRSDRQSRT